MGGELEHSPVGIDRLALGIDVLGLDLPAARDGFLDQDPAFDDERTLVPTSTAAPDEAPQSLDLRVLVAVLVARLEFPGIGQASAAFAAATR
ncbi:MAG: hypothetical protein JWN39_2688 [Ilumatobacteraceae bacterium]|nr:hypothetical protein [Ilumatobacteraceae bacterium]